MVRIWSFDLVEQNPEQNPEQGLYIPVRDGQLLAGPQEGLVVLSRAQLDDLHILAQPRFAGRINGSIDCFSVSVSGNATSGFEWVPPRSLLTTANGAEYDALARCLQLVSWQQDHAYCGRCGAPTDQHPQEAAMVCHACNKQYFPRISPCIITVVERDDHCLLAQHTGYRSAFYAALAGFVEAGESLESAVHREVMEETGVRIRDLEYFGSQSWPFPGQLMVGFRAQYDSGDIQVDEKEILHADWFRYDQLPDIPSEFSIAGRLIRAFAHSRG